MDAAQRIKAPDAQIDSMLYLNFTNYAIAKKLILLLEKCNTLHVHPSTTLQHLHGVSQFC